MITKVNRNSRNRFPFWSVTETSEIDLSVTCPHPGCLKKIGLESRFVEPKLPFNFACPYCGQNLTITTAFQEGND